MRIIETHTMELELDSDVWGDGYENMEEPRIRDENVSMTLRMPCAVDVVRIGWHYPSHASARSIDRKGVATRTRADFLGLMINKSRDVEVEHPSYDAYDADDGIDPSLGTFCMNIYDEDFAGDILTNLIKTRKIHEASLCELITIFDHQGDSRDVRWDMVTMQFVVARTGCMIIDLSLEHEFFCGKSGLRKTERCIFRHGRGLHISRSRNSLGPTLGALIGSLLHQRDNDSSGFFAELANLVLANEIAPSLALFVTTYDREFTADEVFRASQAPYAGLGRRVYGAEFFGSHFGLTLQQLCDTMANSGAMLQHAWWADFKKMAEKVPLGAERLVVPITILIHHDPGLVLEGRYGNWARGMSIALFITLSAPKMTKQLEWREWGKVLKDVLQVAVRHVPVMKQVDIVECAAPVLGVSEDRVAAFYKDLSHIELLRFCESMLDVPSIKARVWADGTELVATHCKRGAEDMLAGLTPQSNTAPPFAMSTTTSEGRCCLDFCHLLSMKYSLI